MKHILHGIVFSGNLTVRGMLLRGDVVSDNSVLWELSLNSFKVIRYFASQRLYMVNISKTFQKGWITATLAAVKRVYILLSLFQLSASANYEN